MRGEGASAVSCAMSAPGGEGAGHLALDLGLAGGRTYLARQFVSYPFHLTRPFYLDREPAAHLATLYLQSASGGLYAGERLTAEIRAGAGTACQLTSQASTLVHDSRGRETRIATSLTVEPGAFLAWLPEPLILFPGATLESETEIRLAPDAVVLLSESFLCHDPQQRARPFEGYRNAVRVLDADGRGLLEDRQRVAGRQLQSHTPQGRWPASASLYALGVSAEEPAWRALAEAADAPGVLGGMTALPNGSGLGLRLLAEDGVALTRALTRAFELAFEARYGTEPAPRRK